MNEPKVAIIIINWNQKQHTKECLDSLKNINYQNYEVILVDNASKDNSVAFFKKDYSYANIIENKKNLGFAEGNNVGIREALSHNADYVFILNNDTIVDKEILKELIKSITSDSTIGAVTPKIYNYYQPNVIDAAGGFLSFNKSKIHQIGYGELDKGQYDKEYPINFITGSAMLARADVFKIVGLFDATFFAYCEDMDFCHRMQQNGFKLKYVPQAKIWHKVSASTGGYKNPTSLYLFTKNRIKFLYKHATLKPKLLFSFYLLYYIPAFTIYNLLLRKKQSVKSFFRAIFGYFFPFIWIKDFEYPYFLEEFVRIGINARYLQRPVTGIERYLLELTKNISKLDNKNKYILFFNQHLPIIKITDNDNFEYFITKHSTKRNIQRIIWEEFFLFFELIKKKVDVFHGPSFVSPFFKSSKEIITIHDLTFLFFKEGYTLMNKLYFGLFLPKSIRKADIIIANSHSTKKDILKYYDIPEQKIKVVHLGIDPNFKKSYDPDELNSIKQKYKIPEKFFLFVGLLSPRKNIKNILEAFYLFKKENNSNHKFVIVGKKGWLYSDIFQFIEENNLVDEIIFTDYVDEKDLSAIYSSATAFLFTSLYEGFGLPILEAMSCGCPVITSNLSSMPEVGGDAALYVNPYLVNEIKDAMNLLLENKELRQNLINKGHNQVKKFSWEKTARETLEIYRELSR